MDGTYWMLGALTVGLVLALLGVIFFTRYKKEGGGHDYRTFYTMGLLWTIIGVPFYFSSNSLTFLGMGIVFLVVGLANKSKWKNPEPITPQRRKVMIGLVSLTILLVLVTALGTFFAR